MEQENSLKNQLAQAFKNANEQEFKKLWNQARINNDKQAFEQTFTPEKNTFLQHALEILKFSSEEHQQAYANMIEFMIQQKETDLSAINKEKETAADTARKCNLTGIQEWIEKEQKQRIDQSINRLSQEPQAVKDDAPVVSTPVDSSVIHQRSATPSQNLDQEDAQEQSNVHYTLPQVGQMRNEMLEQFTIKKRKGGDLSYYETRSFQVAVKNNLQPVPVFRYYSESSTSTIEKKPMLGVPHPKIPDDREIKAMLLVAMEKFEQPILIDGLDSASVGRALKVAKELNIQTATRKEIGLNLKVQSASTPNI